MISIDEYRLIPDRGFVVALASDHAGVDMRCAIWQRLYETMLDHGNMGHYPLSLGPVPIDGRVDYPDYANKLVSSILSGEADRGILICGSGIGMSMAANRHKGIRCALVHDVTTARLLSLIHI